MKSLTFLWKSDIRIVGIMGDYLLFKNLLISDQYVFGAVSELSNLTFILVIYLSVASVISAALFLSFGSIFPGYCN